jgi:hypothetical protein
MLQQSSQILDWTAVLVRVSQGSFDSGPGKLPAQQKVVYPEHFFKKDQKLVTKDIKPLLVHCVGLRWNQIVDELRLLANMALYPREDDADEDLELDEAA